MLVDSHCHLDRLDLAPYQHDFAAFMAAPENREIEYFLAIAIDLETFPALRALTDGYANISLSAGVHPNERQGREPTLQELVDLGRDPKIIAIGETGLDYFRSEGDLSWQQQRFRRHIQAARQLKKPLVIHTRAARDDTLRILREENGGDAGGIIHCFTEDWAFARQALDLNFYISFSGIITFKNADEIRDVAKKVPADRFLIETDSPYLAPVPFRGKPNYPAYVRYVASQVAELRGVSCAAAGDLSTRNFHHLFGF